MRLRFLAPIPELANYVTRVWVFESAGSLPDFDMRLFVPNGSAKLIVPFRNGLSGALSGRHHLSKEHRITLVGACDEAAIIDVEDDRPSGSIGIELNPMSAYRFFPFAQWSMLNRIHLLRDVIGPHARDIEERIAAAAGVAQKVTLLQRFLVRRLSNAVVHPAFDYCIGRIGTTNGAVTARELESETGYSARWLNVTFRDKLGMSPKRFASIVRFEHCYTMLMHGRHDEFVRRELHRLYYDQSHFARDFTRFTGFSPTRFAREHNAFGRLFYER